MKLYEAIKEIFNQVGYDSIRTPRFINMLSDFSAFKDVPALKYVMSNLVERYGRTLYKQYERGKHSPILIQKFQQDIVENFGFNPDLVEYALDSISYGFGWISQVPQYAVSVKLNPKRETSLAKPNHHSDTIPIPDATIKPYETFWVGGVSFTMVSVKGGSFTMGVSPKRKIFSRVNERPAHQVILDNYMIGQTQVTQELWQAVMSDNPSCHKGNNLPVENVSWYDCQDFIQRLSQQTGRKFRLPTEAEWEFAARGGNKSKGYVYAGSNDIDEVGWCGDNSGETTHCVCTKAPNELDLYDMSGNVWEWCQDLYGKYDSVPCRNPQGPIEGSYRVYRGGDHWFNASFCRVFCRDGHNPESRNYYLGLRLAL